VCGALLTLLLQLNGALPSQFPTHDRRLYILSCRRKACRRKDGSVRAIRGNKITKSKASHIPKTTSHPKEDTTPQHNIGAALFGGASQGSPLANPFSSASNPFSTSSANPFAGVSSLASKPAQPPNPIPILTETFASKAQISNSSAPLDPSFKPATSQQPPTHEPWPAEAEFPSPYPKTFLDADYETLSAPSTPQVIPETNPDIDTDMSGTSGTEKLFESTMDKTFQKFADRMAQNPEQILRYEFRGQPLLYSTSDPVGKIFSGSSGKVGTVSSSNGGKIPRCTSCGAERVFELQLTPHAITVLEDEELSLDGMDWGTIILGVCGNDCSPTGTMEGEVGYLDEWVGVQWEELSEKRR
jgi:pre-rRNA-processing protein TSR4